MRVEVGEWGQLKCALLPSLEGINNTSIDVETAFSSHPAVAGGVKILFESHLGGADLHLPNNSCVLYLSECDVIAGNGYKRKLVRYRNVGFGHKLGFSICSMATDKLCASSFQGQG